MYEYIKGVVTHIYPSYLVLESNQIGYQISIGNPYQYSGKMNKEVVIYVHQVIREDAHTLYGFQNLEEKQLFLRLISVSGIGPKSAVAIMTNEDHQGLITAIETADVNFLIKFPGVGKKTAQQMILDLKGKLGELTIEAELMPLAFSNALEEALEALEALGYSDRDIKRISKQLVVDQSKTTDEYLREALKLIMKK